MFHKIAQLNIQYLFIPFSFVVFITSCNSSDSLQGNKRSRLLSESELFSKKEYNSLQQALKEPDSVYKLNISGQGITVIPKEILKLKNLQYLNIGDNKLTVLPDEICNLENLEEIVVYSNSFEALPQDMGRLQNLKSISAYNNRLKNLPESICQLSRLEDLVLDNNNLSALPTCFENLHQLKRISLNQNQLSRFDFDLGKPGKLEYISVFENKFSDAYLYDLSKKYTKIEIQNDDCTFNTHYKELSSEYIINGGIKNYTWRASDSTAIGFLENGDSILTKIGGCIYYEHTVEFIVHDDFTLADSVHWLSRALALFTRFKDSATSANIKLKRLKLDETNSNRDRRIYSIVDENGVPERNDREGYNDTGIVFKSKGNNTYSISYSWYMD
jgi:hypothetical protein